MTALRACTRCIRRQYQYLPGKPAAPQPPRRLLSTTANPLRSNANPLQSGNARTARDQDTARSRRSAVASAAGIAACAMAMYGVIELDVFGLQDAEQQQQRATMKMDGPSGFPSADDNGNGNGDGDGEIRAGHSVIRIKGQDGVDQVDTGTSTIPYFPSTIRLPRATTLDPGSGSGSGSDSDSLNPGDEVPAARIAEADEYQLLGLGIRTVSFLRIQVYVVGLYVSTADIAELQTRLVRTALNPPAPKDKQGTAAEEGGRGLGANFATSLVPGERQQLKELLLDGELGDAAWEAILKKDGLRTAFRIVPTRNTDFLHLRDGWVRGITGRAQKSMVEAGGDGQKGGEFGDDSFGAALNTFKGLFGGGHRKSVPKGQTLLLLRGARGELDALFEPDTARPARWLGRVSDERISRLVWLNYLAGKNVSSEGARKSVVDGVMGIVERPVGTVVQKVV